MVAGAFRGAKGAPLSKAGRRPGPGLLETLPNGVEPLDDQTAIDSAVKPAPVKGPRKAAVGFVFATAVMDILAMGIIIPILPQLVREFTHGDNAQAAHYMGDF